MGDVISAALVDFTLKADGGIVVRPFRKHDAQELFALTVANRDSLSEWLTWVPSVATVEDTREYLRSSERSALEHRAFVCGIYVGGPLAGAIELHDIDWVNRHAKIGYWLDEANRGRGIMTRAAHALVEYAFDALDLNRIEIRAAAENRPSRAVAERLDFRLEGILRKRVLLHGEFHDYAVYGALRSEWQGGEGA
jgi:ribosomal-protein-serine acetyltransferase